MKTLIVLSCSLCLLVGCSGIKSMKVTENNLEQVSADVKKAASEGKISSEELAAFEGYTALAKLRMVLANEDLLSGKTVGQIIDDANAFKKEFLGGTAKDEEKARAESEKQMMRAAELAKYVKVSVYDKEFEPSDYMSHRMHDGVSISCKISNPSDKNLRAFRGVLVVSDLFDREIKKIEISSEDPLGAGEDADLSWVVDINQFNSDDMKLKNTDFANLKIAWFPLEIIFADGTRLGSAK